MKNLNLFERGVLYLPAIILLLVIYAASRANGIAAYEIFVDLNEIAEKAPYVGFFSYMGILLWTAISTACFFSAAIVNNQKSQVKKKFFSFLVCSGLFFALIMVDDIFQVHEYIALFMSGGKSILDNSIRELRDFYEGIVIALYASLFLFYLLHFRKLFAQGNASILLISIIFLMMSAIVDFNVLNFRGVNQEIWIEDGSKFLGIWGLFLYYIDYCQFVVKKQLN